MALPKELTTVTPLSKLLAMILFITFPFIAFIFGMKYQHMLDLLERREYETIGIERKITPTPQQVPMGLELVQVSYEGGLCPNRPCTASYIFQNNGMLYDTNNKVHKIRKTDFDILVKLINTTNFEEIKGKKYTGVCPTAYDGSEVVYTFYTEKTTERIASCEVHIDTESPLFKLIHEIIAGVS